MQFSVTTLYVDIINKRLVSALGSPTSVPLMYCGDTASIAIIPVVPGNSNGAFTPVTLTGYTLDLILAGTPNATNPPIPFAALQGMTWTAQAVLITPATSSASAVYYPGFVGNLNLTTTPVFNFVGTNQSAQAFITLALFDTSQNRDTVYQAQFTLAASNDDSSGIPSGPATQYLTLAQALNIFQQIGGFPGKQTFWVSADGSHTVQQTLGNDGNMQYNPQ